MNSVSFNNYQYNLTEQISGYVDKIKYKTSKLDNYSMKDNAEGESPYNHRALHNYPYSLLDSASSYSLKSGTEPAAADNLKASSAYQFVSNALEEPKILIDFMHKNNQRYDIIT